MTISIHQPNYLPWCGFFHKMSLCDRFVLLDTVPFSKNSFQNRCRIKSVQNVQWLTVPVSTSGHFAQHTNEVALSFPAQTLLKHLRTIEQNYSHAPHFQFLYERIEPIYRQKWELLADFCSALISALAKALSIQTPLIKASELPVKGTRSDLLLDICHATDANQYISGPSGRNYLDLSIFEKAGIRVQFHEFNHPRYPQLYDEFEKGLSVIDLLANCGPSSRQVLIIT
jgi:hypothetical protein